MHIVNSDTVIVILVIVDVSVVAAALVVAGGVSVVAADAVVAVLVEVVAVIVVVVEKGREGNRLRMHVCIASIHLVSSPHFHNHYNIDTPFC